MYQLPWVQCIKSRLDICVGDHVCIHVLIQLFPFLFFLFFLLPPFPLSQCVFSLADEGKECGRGKVCEQGACIVDRAPRASTQPKVSTIDNQLVIESNDGLKMIAREVEFKLGDGSEFTAGSLYRSTAESAETVADLKTVLETTLVRLLHFFVCICRVCVHCH